FANDAFVGDAVQGDTTGITEVIAARQFADSACEIEQRVFQCGLYGAGECFVLRRAVGPSFAISKSQRHGVFVVKTPVRDFEKVARRKYHGTVRRQPHDLPRFGWLAKDLLCDRGEHSAKTAE